MTYGGMEAQFYIQGYTNALSSSLQAVGGDGYGVVMDNYMVGDQVAPNFYAGSAPSGSFFRFTGRSTDHGIQARFGDGVNFQCLNGTTAFKISGSAQRYSGTHSPESNTHQGSSGQLIGIHKIQAKSGSIDKFYEAPSGWQYQTFIHNFQGQITSTERFVPWENGLKTFTTDLGDEGATGYLSMFDMRLVGINWRFEDGTILDGTHNLLFRLKKIDNLSSTVDTIASATYTATMTANKMFKVQRGDFDVDPDVSSGDLCGILIDGAGTINNSANAAVWVTSFWMVDYGHES